MLTAVQRTQRARLAALRRHRRTDDLTDDLARDFKADRLAEYVKATVDAAPALNAEQRARIALLLAGGPSAA
jgi:hypothetical protein